MDRTVAVVDGAGKPYPVRLRTAQQADRRALATSWSQALQMGPRSWPDLRWSLQTLDSEDEVHFPLSPHMLVLADEAHASAHGDLLGLVVTSGPVTPSTTNGLDPRIAGTDPVLWVEYLAIAPGLRLDCDDAHRRPAPLKRVGLTMMAGAILRSGARGCAGRIGLHGDGAGAQTTYARWKLARLADVSHRLGGTYPVYFGDSAWAAEFTKEMWR